MTITETDISQLAAAIVAHIRGIAPRVVVAFSGGVDSTVVARLAKDALEGDALCVSAWSESNTADDIDACRAIAEEHGLNWRLLEYSELAIPNYAENPANRCFFCKDALYSRVDHIKAEFGAGAILDGSNTDDAGDYRPGMTAASNHGVRSPLRECGVDKEGVRALARHLGLPNHDKPSSPCLSSRVPYGEPITHEKLTRIAEAEKFLRGLGLRELRVRHHERMARIEVPLDCMADVMAHRDAIVAEFRKLGFIWVAMDLAGFQSGSLNAALKR